VFKRVRALLLIGAARVQGSVSSQRGAAIIEYVLLAAVIVVGLFTTFGSLKTALLTKLNTIINTITGA
jgi:Flp pilus assembly pilin Flp